MYKAIIDKHKNIELEPESHTYTLNNSDLEFSSVTEFINTFFAPFDELKIANKLTQFKKYQHMSTQDILQDWEQRRKRGTIVHKEIEDYVLFKKSMKLDPKSKQGVNFLQEKCMSNKNNLLFPEVKICSEKLHLAGTIDLMIYNKEKNKIYLIDWKTNVEIKKNGFKKGIKKSTQLIDDCSFNRYTLQLSMYQYILETYYNAAVDGLYIIHLKDDTYHTIKCNFEKTHITNMLQSVQ